MDRQHLGRICMALPGTTVDHPFGPDHDTYKVGGKMFAVVGGTGDLSFKASEIAFEMLTEQGLAKPAPYLARAKWVHLDNPADWSEDELTAYLGTAHRIIVGKLTKKSRMSLGLI